MTEVVTVYDERRECGYRREGVYLVSADNSTGGPGSIGVSDEAAGLMLLNPPIPVDARTVPPRGYAYVDGEAIVNADPAGPPIEAPRIAAEIAEARAFCWRVLGMDYSDRVGNGICVADDRIEAVLGRVTSLAWQDHKRYLRWLAAMSEAVDEARAVCGDVQMLPLIVGVHGAYQAVRSEPWSEVGSIHGYGLTGAGAALGAAWRLLHAARWLADVKIAQRTAGLLIPACGADADAPYALRFRPPAYRPAPDLVDWVGERFYPTASVFIEETQRLGISRRMPGIPKAVVVPWSRAFVAHAKCELADGRKGPGVFGYYQVAQMQYVMGDSAAIPPWLKVHGVQPVQVKVAVGQRELAAVA